METAKRDDIVEFCTNYLKAADFKDYCANGLQVEGAFKVGKIITGVSWSERLVNRAIKAKAEMVLVHHGLFGNMLGNPPVISGAVSRRLGQLLRNNISLVGFHLPLDAHPRIGNNAAICKVLGISKLKPCDVGFVGNLSRPCDIKFLVKSVNKKLTTDAKILAFGPSHARRIGVISGGSSDCFPKALATGADTFICGDLREEVVRLAEEEHINIINAGHYNSERFGVQKLGKLIAKRFGISVEFFEVPCEV
jgi:dinuclear metal center YbgI/SA1388 family protein